MHKVTSGMIQHKGKFYRKGEVLPKTFDNKERYSHVVLMEKDEVKAFEKEQKAKASA